MGVCTSGATYSIEITPVSLDGTLGIFFAHSFAITHSDKCHESIMDCY